MTDSITWLKQEALKGYGTDKEKVVLQKLAMTAHEALHQAAAEVASAITSFDEQLGATQGVDAAGRAAQVGTFNQVCKSVMAAQQVKAQRPVEREWSPHKERDKSLDNLNLQFAVSLATKGVALAATVSSAVGTSGFSLAFKIVKAVKTAVSIGLEIKGFAADRDGAADDVMSQAATLTQLYQTQASTTHVKKVAREVGAAVGIPFVDSVRRMEAALEVFRAKSARVDRTAQ